MFLSFVKRQTAPRTWEPSKSRAHLTFWAPRGWCSSLNVLVNFQFFLLLKRSWKISSSHLFETFSLLYCCILLARYVGMRTVKGLGNIKQISWTARSKSLSWFVLTNHRQSDDWDLNIHFRLNRVGGRVWQGNLVLSTKLISWINHCWEFQSWLASVSPSSERKTKD